MLDFDPRSWTNPLQRPGKDFAQQLPASLLNNLLVVCCAILLKETVNLNKLKNHVGLLLGNRQTKTDSHYKRLTRFFNDKTALRHLWKWLIIWLINYVKSWDGRSQSIYLTLDGTNWQLGGGQIHLLMLCLVYRGVSLPLLWHNLGKKGHSSQQERKRLLQQAMKLYPLKGFCLLADREYEGKECGADFYDLCKRMCIVFVIIPIFSNASENSQH